MSSADKLSNSRNLGGLREILRLKGEGTISTRLRLGDLLIRAKLVSEQDVAKALQRLSLCGGRLGENLVAIGALTQEQKKRNQHQTPQKPENNAATGLD